MYFLFYYQISQNVITDSNKEVVAEVEKPAEVGPIDPDTLIPM